MPKKNDKNKSKSKKLVGKKKKGTGSKKKFKSPSDSVLLEVDKLELLLFLNKRVNGFLFFFFFS
jgi:hypothetical protein